MAGSLEGHFAAWANKGYDIAVLSLLLDNPDDTQPAQIASADTWRTQFGITSGYVGVDPMFQMVPGNMVGTPQISVINPRTMEVLLLQEGWDGDYPPIVEQTAQANQ
ncbi:MAG TPA: hypothetical protein ENK23_08435 [Sorangium sp.]|nr:hypothetical protein [Sorangium sp.]